MTNAVLTLGARYIILVLVIGGLAWAAARQAPTRPTHDEHNPGCTLLLIVVGVVAALIAVGVLL